MAEIFRGSVPGVARTARKLSRAERDLNRLMQKEMDSLSRRVLAIYRAQAPGGLADEVHVQRTGGIVRPGFSVTVKATDPTSGYNYLGVTRFGHRRKWIEPDLDRAPASVVATHVRRSPHRGSRPALRFVDKATGRVIFRYRVRGVRHSQDWVRVARDQTQPMISESTQRLGRRVVSSIR